MEIEAVSSNDKIILRSENAVFDDSKDQDVKGKLLIAGLNKYDWAYINVGKSGNIEIDKSLSQNLTAGKKVIVMGYTHGLGGSSNSSNISPLLSESTVANDGLSPRGYILLTDRGYGGGNSGGPAFVRDGNSYKAIGIVSAADTEGASIGKLVPIGAIN